MYVTPKHAMSKHSANCTLDWPTPVRANRLSGQNPQSTCIVARPGLATRSGDQCVRRHSIFHPMSLFSMTFQVYSTPSTSLSTKYHRVYTCLITTLIYHDVHLHLHIHTWVMAFGFAQYPLLVNFLPFSYIFIFTPCQQFTLHILSLVGISFSFLSPVCLLRQQDN